ncbi:helix-turn-helix domain-containing protein [Solirubrobacter sp. CPCC 204708]|uniref:helix-turn-helix domain-containing protein n=1 Tax=Solirubrobacter deserti TaxID=2282478 RepID=UPI002AFB820F|nr:helix-turn-helix domain-containing protein [Solirubrobacter deserti]
MAYVGQDEAFATPQGSSVGQGPVIPSPCRPLFDRESLANHLRLSTDTIDRLVKAGRLPCVRIGSQVRFTNDDVEAFIANHRQLGPAA